MLMQLIIASITSGSGAADVILAGLIAADPLTSTILNGGDLPIAAIRFNTNGTAEEATGDSGGALSYSQALTDFLDNNTLDGDLYEVKITAVSETGAAGTMTGATIGSFIAISSQRTYHWQKDANTTGTATKRVDIQVREISLPSNSVTISNFDFVAVCSA